MYCSHCWNGLVGAALAGHGWLQGVRSSVFFPPACCCLDVLLWPVGVVLAGAFFSVQVFCILLLCISNLTYFVTYIVFILIVYTCNLASGCQVSMFLTWTIKLFYSILYRLGKRWLEDTKHFCQEADIPSVAAAGHLVLYSERIYQ